MLKLIYSCEICREQKQKQELLGCKFSDMHKFKFSDAGDTDGVHICMECLDILREELEKRV